MRRDHEVRRLAEARVLAGMLADRMMAAYVVGSRPGEGQVRALCAAVLLLEEHAVPLPPFAEDVVARLAAEDAVEPDAPAPAPAVPGRAGLVGRALSHGRLRLGW